MAVKRRLIGTLGVLAWLGQGCALFDLTQEQLRQRDRVSTEPPPAGTMAFHVIGVCQGRPPPGSRGDCLSITEPECQQMLLHQVEHRVDVRVADTGHNLVLGLSAHEKTHWHLNLEPGATLDRVILSGVYPQRISGVGGGVRLGGL